MVVLEYPWHDVNRRMREGTVMMGARYRAVNLLLITCHAVCQERRHHGG
jgi:hypothetical protein